MSYMSTAFKEIFMRQTFSSLLAVLAIGAMSCTAWAQPANVKPNTGSVHATVPMEPGKGSPADADYKTAKDACNAKKSADEKVACLRDAKAAYNREEAADKSVPKR
ncbi:MAG TPA: hypothetical protein VEY94_10155 [Patescibacteria group bacterium]|nr:hypothetical protein [Patescibacteria group bacterium]